MLPRIKKNDLVKVLSGKDRGKSGRVLKVWPKENRAVVEGLNLKKRHRRPRRQGEKGQIIQIPSPIHISNFLLVCPSCKAAQRTRMILESDGQKTRVCRKCAAKIT